MNQHEQGATKAFTHFWWFWLVSTGVWLGATISMKWVGLFTVGWVGSLTLVQLWTLFGDPCNRSMSLWFKHFTARLLCLMVITICVYLSTFGLHFWCFTDVGESRKFMSPEFQATLNMTNPDTPADVFYGSYVPIRHWNTYNYLHSHNHTYLNGSKQQQVTAYPKQEGNNLWTIENQTIPVSPDGSSSYNTCLVFVESGSVIRLNHMSTNRRLHAHSFPAPVTSEHDEISDSRQKESSGDDNDLFRVEIDQASSEPGAAKARLKAIHSKFRLVHLKTGCVLSSHKVRLPVWGFGQQEVTCAHGDDSQTPNTIWYIEGNLHPFMDDATEKTNYRQIRFFRKTWESHIVMWQQNAGLIKPHSWSLALLLGQSLEAA